MDIIKPMNKNILVEPETKETISKGGIVIPETANQKAPTKGRVVAIAEDSDMKLKISLGDLVLFSKFSGTEITIPAHDMGQLDRHYLLIKDENILAVIERGGV